MKDSTKVILIIIGLLSTLVITLSDVHAQPSGPVGIEVICAVMLDWSWNCDERWVIYIYKDFDVFKYCYPGVQGFHHAVAGCATYDDNRGHSIILGRYGGDMSTHTGHGSLEHELIHMGCLCNFHANPPEEPRR